MTVTEQQQVRLVNGVFKGGGARGTAYAGALAAVKERNIWFGSVAGASAGAITATLIAAGLGPDDVAREAPKALKRAHAFLPRRIAKAVIGHATSVFESRGLREWLNALLVAQLKEKGRQSASGWVTFQELFEAYDIELYVVVMDLATSLPVTFSRRTTPDVEVAGAVCASSAIPGAFPPGRAVFDTGKGVVSHQLVDGGAYANYPSFVFDDESFREWLRLTTDVANSGVELDRWVDECERPTLGFVLGAARRTGAAKPVAMLPNSGPRISRRFDRGPTYTSSDRLQFIFGSILSSDFARLFITLAMAIWITISVVTLPVGLRRYAAWLDELSIGAAFPVVLVASTVIIALAAAVTIGVFVVLLLVGRLIADTLLPSVKALIGVPTDVAPWIGLGPRSVVIEVPTSGLKTTKFNISQADCDAAVEKARASVREQLANASNFDRLEPLLNGEPPTPLHTLPTGSTGPDNVVPIVAGSPVVDRDKASQAGLVFAAAVAALVGGLGWWATNSAGIESLLRIGIVVAVGMVAVGVALFVMAGRTGLRASGRANRAINNVTRPRARLALLSAPAGLILLVVGVALSSAAMSDRDESTSRARVTAAKIVDGRNQYDVATADGGTETITADRHLRLGERVFVGEREGTTQLVGALDHGTFAWAVIFTLLGLGLITSAIKRFTWVLRCRRLTRLVNT